MLAAIDGALNDYDTSEDAMRWSAEPVVVTRQPVPQFSLSEQDAAAFHDGMRQMMVAMRAYEPALKLVAEQAGRTVRALLAAARHMGLTPAPPPRSAGQRRVECQMRAVRRRAARREQRSGTGRR